jgi:hypothetical protein
LWPSKPVNSRQFKVESSKTQATSVSNKTSRAGQAPPLQVELV